MKLIHLAELKVQKIFVTATLAVRLEGIFKCELGLLADTYIIRDRSNQPQIGYHVLDFDKKQCTPTKLVLAVLQFFENFTTDRKTIIFCPSIEMVETLGKLIKDSAISHSRMQSDVKDAEERKWFQGTCDTLIGTTGVTHGIDAPDVALVIMVEQLFGFTNIFQAAGRAGRDGNPAFATYLHNVNKQFPSPRSTHDFEAFREGKLLVKTKQCRWIIISQFLDGIAMTCADLHGAVLCDVCSADNNLTIG